MSSRLDDDRKWAEHWDAQGQPWRREPEIEADRQADLRRYLGGEVDIKQGKYPFSGVKLDRADIEWLLDEHVSGGQKGPIESGDMTQRHREGLDLRGAIIAPGTNLNGLPLARIKGSLTDDESRAGPRTLAALQLKGVELKQADLSGALLQGVDLSGAKLNEAKLFRADLRGAVLCGANLQDAHLEGCDLRGAYLARGPHGAAPPKKPRRWRRKKNPCERESKPDSTRADLRRAYFDTTSNLSRVCLSDSDGIGVRVADVRWGDVNLADIAWHEVHMLGDECAARSLQRKDKQRLDAYLTGVRANRQLSRALASQALDDAASTFGFRAHLLERPVHRWERRGFRWLFSFVLHGVSGYGYRLRNIIVSYLFVVTAFAILYGLNGAGCLSATNTVTNTVASTSGAVCNGIAPHAVLEVFVLSLTAFHGRVFAVSFGLGSLLGALTAFEAIIGLVIESIFIAMLIERFFGK